MTSSLNTVRGRLRTLVNLTARELAERRELLAFGLAQRLGRGIANESRFVELTNKRLRRRYLLRPYSGPMLLFRAAEQMPRYRDLPSLGWELLVAGSLEVCPVPGSHNTILHEPNVSVIAQRMRERLK